MDDMAGELSLLAALDLPKNLHQLGRVLQSEGGFTRYSYGSPEHRPGRGPPSRNASFPAPGRGAGRQQVSPSPAASGVRSQTVSATRGRPRSQAARSKDPVPGPKKQGFLRARWSMPGNRATWITIDRIRPTPVRRIYTVSAEFHDVLQAQSDRRLAEHRFGTAAAVARTGVVDVGAGTGIVAEVPLARRGHPSMPSSRQVHAGGSADPPCRAERRSARQGQRPSHDVPSRGPGASGGSGGVFERRPSRGAGATPGTVAEAAATALAPGGVVLLEPPPHVFPTSRVRDLPPVRVRRPRKQCVPN